MHIPAPFAYNADKSRSSPKWLTTGFGTESGVYLVINSDAFTGHGPKQLVSKVYMRWMFTVAIDDCRMTETHQPGVAGFIWLYLVRQLVETADTLRDNGYAERLILLARCGPWPAALQMVRHQVESTGYTDSANYIR